MKKADLITGCVLLILSGFTIWESWRMPESATFGPGPGFLPFWIGVIVAGLAAMLILSAWLRSAGPGGPRIFPGKKGLLSVGLVLLALALYTIFMEPLGFLANTLLFVAFLMAVVQREGIKTTAAVAVLTTAALYIIFHTLLGITLPRSPFGF